MNSILAFWDDYKELDKNVLGNKGYNIIRMFQEGVNVPYGFVISTAVCKDYFINNRTISENFKEMIKNKCEELMEKTGKVFGNINNPLIVSIRSGAPESMPGMLDTVLNVGITKDMAFKCQEKYILRSYIVFLNEYIKGVYDIDLAEKDDDSDFKSVDQYKEIISNKLSRFQQTFGKEFEDSISQIIENTVCSVFNSWNKSEAKFYRRQKNISDEMYTAVVIQEMVFGNRNERSGSGVIFTCNPITGKDEIYGEYILNGQGNDVVNGMRNTLSISELKNDMEDIYTQLSEQVNKIKKICLNPQDIEFTFENGVMYILQTRDVRARIK
jgi:pyruvate, phosphate dikinase